MTLRHELKYQINALEHHVLKKKLAAILKPDPYMLQHRSYNVRTLYFDDYQDSAYHNKQAGVFKRKKYRLRIYNHSDSVIKFECKSKIGQYVLKNTTRVTRREADRLIAEDFDFFARTDNRLLHEFYLESKCKIMRPVTLVEYEREAYVHPIGNVRITFDTCLRSGLAVNTFFDKEAPTMSVLDFPVVLEVKYTEVFPEYIRGLFPDTIRPRLALGKYVICRNQQLSQKGML